MSFFLGGLAQSFELFRSTSSVNEGDSFTVTLNTKRVPDGTTVPYTVSGINSSDISTGSTNGSFNIVNGTDTLSFTVANDQTTEGTETFTLSLDNGEDLISVTINDTSQEPTGIPSVTFEGSTEGLDGVSFNTTLPVGKIIAECRTVNGGPLSLSFNGNFATKIASDNSTDNSQDHDLFEYDNPTGSSQTVELIVPNGGLECIVCLYSVENANSVSGFTTLPRSTNSNESIIFASSSSNNPAGIPSQTNSLNVNFNRDIRSGEIHFSSHLNGSTTLSDTSSTSESNTTTVIAIIS